MILLTSALLAISVLCLIPQTQVLISNFTGITRRKIVFVGLALVAVWDYAVFKSMNFSFGVLCLVISITMMFIVPRSERVRDWMKDILFEGQDILDKNAPYAEIVGLFKFPLFCLGLWLAAPWSIVFVEVVPILLAFGIYFYKTRRLPKVIRDVVDEYMEGKEETEKSANEGASTTTI